MYKDSHYAWLDKHFHSFLTSLTLDASRYGCREGHCGFNLAHGDKCWSYRSIWDEHGIPFPHGVAIYFLTYMSPWSKESRETETGWVAPVDWVVHNYERFKPHLTPIE